MRTVLYLGTDPSHFQTEGRLIHYPVIKIVPKSLQDPDIAFALTQLGAFTHFIFTSKNAVSIFCSHLKSLQIPVQECLQKTVIAIGQVTAHYLQAEGMVAHHIALTETQEGVVELLNTLSLNITYVFLPRSSLSRPVLTQYLTQRNIRHLACDFYDTVTQKLLPCPDLKFIDEIVFTSPSTVKAFLEIFGEIPEGKKISTLGPLTEEMLTQVHRCLCN